MSLIKWFVGLKLDECKLTIKEMGEVMEEIARREPYIKKGGKEYDALLKEFMDAAHRRQKLFQAKDRLMTTYVRIEMDELIKE